MTDKERLERIIQMQYDGYTIWDMGENDLIWLIEQAGRVSEQETRINNLTFDLAVSRVQNKRYREELDILGEVINSAPNADKLNEEYERLKGLEGEE